MKTELVEILNKYLELFPDEKLRLKEFISFLENSSDEKIIDWNNFLGHVVASGFVYSIKDKKFLVLFHKDLKMDLYPGGHLDQKDKSVLDAAIREIKEETGIENFKELPIDSDPMVPLDIDVQDIPYNERLHLPTHLHFDFRYLFLTLHVLPVKPDEEEMDRYQWISLEKMRYNGYGVIVDKIETLLKEQNYM